MASLKLLCERYDIELDELDENSLFDVLAKLETSGVKLSTIKEFKFALKITAWNAW